MAFSLACPLALCRISAFGIFSMLVIGWASTDRDVVGGSGFWPDKHLCLPLGHGVPVDSWWSPENAACPQWHIVRDWQGRSAFVEKAKNIEALAETASDTFGRMESPRPTEFEKCGLSGDTIWVDHLQAKGFAWSRIEADMGVGSTQFSITDGASWPGGFVEHYVDKHGVLPSASLQRSISEFDLDAFRHVLEKMIACIPLPSELRI